jgi:hypothetical protein
MILPENVAQTVSAYLQENEFEADKQIFHCLVNKLKTTGLLPDKKPDTKRNVLTEETLDDICVRLETSSTKSLK